MYQQLEQNKLAFSIIAHSGFPPEMNKDIPATPLLLLLVCGLLQDICKINPRKFQYRMNKMFILEKEIGISLHEY